MWKLFIAVALVGGGSVAAAMYANHSATTDQGAVLLDPEIALSTAALQPSADPAAATNLPRQSQESGKVVDNSLFHTAWNNIAQSERGGSTRTPRQRRLLILEEGRDTSWATTAETRLRQDFNSLSFVSSGATPLNITCAKTVCEVYGVLNGSSVDAVNSNIGAFTKLVGDIAARSSQFDPVDTSTVVAMDKHRPGQLGLLAYFTRR